MYEQNAEKTEIAPRSVFGDLQRESERLMKIVEVLASRLDMILLPDRENEVNVAAVPTADVRSPFGDLVTQFRKTLGALDWIIKRIEL